MKREKQDAYWFLLILSYLPILTQFSKYTKLETHRVVAAQKGASTLIVRNTFVATHSKSRNTLTSL